MEFSTLKRLLSVYTINNPEYRVCLSHDTNYAQLQRPNCAPINFNEDVDRVLKDYPAFKSDMHVQDAAIAAVLAASANNDQLGQLKIVKRSTDDRVVSFTIDGVAAVFVIDATTGYVWTPADTDIRLYDAYKPWAQDPVYVGLMQQCIMLRYAFEYIPNSYHDYIQRLALQYRRQTDVTVPKLQDLLMLQIDYPNVFSKMLQDTKLFDDTIVPCVEYANALKETITKLNECGRDSSCVIEEDGDTVMVMKNTKRTAVVVVEGNYVLTYGVASPAEMRVLASAADSVLQEQQPDNPVRVIRDYMELAGVTDHISEILRMLDVCGHGDAIPALVQFVHDVV